MLVFIIPIKSAKLSRVSWEYASIIFERCLKSVCRQTSSQFRVICVCHELPTVSFEHPHVQYITANFPAPTHYVHHEDPSAWTGLPSGAYRDKGRKLWLGLNHAAQFHPSHI